MEISVSDNGIGLSESEMKNLFRSDFNKSHIHTGDGKGTGLGLVICKEFVKRLGGEFWVEKTIYRVVILNLLYQSVKIRASKKTCRLKYC